MNKKILFFFIIIGAFVFTQKSFAETVPFAFENVKPAVSFSDSSLSVFTSLSVKEIEKLAGRKLSFKEKIAVKIYKHNPSLFKRFADSTEEKKMERKASWSKWLGIGSLIGLIIPGVNLLSLPAAIIAIVFGASTQDNIKTKKNARQGITFGIITLAIILLLAALVVLIVSALGGWR